MMPHEVPAPVICPGRPRTELRCVGCDSDQFRHIFTKGGRGFFRCRKCKIVRIYPLSATDGSQSFYDLEYGTKGGMGAALAAEEDMGRVTARYRSSLCCPYTAGKRWLDVGCSTGVFLDELQKQGYDAEGIDISQIAIDEARRKGLNAHRATIEDFAPEGLYDILTAFDVIEHLLDPVVFLSRAYELLSPGGILAVTTPDTNSVHCCLMGRHWYFYIPEQHLFYFNSRNLSNMLKRLGFIVLSTGRAYKALTYDYIAFQLHCYNPVLYRFWKVLACALPSSWRQQPFRLYIGEMMIIAKKV